MLDDQIIGCFPVQRLCDIVKPLMRESPVHGIHDSSLLIFDDIRIVCHTVRYVIMAFEQVDLVIIYTDI